MICIKNEKREMHKKRKIISSNTMTFVKEIYLFKKNAHIFPMWLQEERIIIICNFYFFLSKNKKHSFN